MGGEKGGKILITWNYLLGFEMEKAWLKTGEEAMVIFKAEVQLHAFADHKSVSS